MTQTAIEGPVEVLFSRRAHAAICAETLEHHPNETGGILLGRFHQNRWQVLEAIDPGPCAECSATSFRYDQGYVNHLAAKLARQYRHHLQVIGLWHRHPGSFDRFSVEDDITNRRFARQSCHGALSCLVNLDPQFRLTAYHVPADLCYQQLAVWVGDRLIDSELRQQFDASDLDAKQLSAVALAWEFQELFACRARSALPLQGAMVAELDRALAQLDQLQQWRYGLRACGDVLQVALVERDGPRRQLWELHATEAGVIPTCVLERGGHGQ
jgi:proteasome lid subunit RPN8/RPN11